MKIQIAASTLDLTVGCNSNRMVFGGCFRVFSEKQPTLVICLRHAKVEERWSDVFSSPERRNYTDRLRNDDPRQTPSTGGSIGATWQQCGQLLNLGAPVKRASTRVEVPSVQLDGSAPKTVPTASP